MNKSRGAFDGFTNLYSLSKTLRFELKPYLEIPEGEKEKLFGDDEEYYKNCKTYTEYYLKKANKEYYDYEKVKNTDLQLINFLHDERIEDAYQVLKPVFDKLHEEFITGSLESAGAKKMDFGEYWETYKKYGNDKEENNNLDKELKKVEKDLRIAIGKLFEDLQQKYIKEEKYNNEQIFVEKEDGKKKFILSQKGVLNYVKKKVQDENFLKNLKTRDGKEIAINDVNNAIGCNRHEAEDIKIKELENNLKQEKAKNKHEKNKDRIEQFKKDIEEQKVIIKEIENGIFGNFFTYFTGFNQNRENYYDLSVDKNGEGKSTAIATRIIEGNLPKFCDNMVDFEKRKAAYLNAYSFLQNKGIDLKDRDGNNLYEIKEELFDAKYFNGCLSQGNIEKYNKEIGNANFLINLYNQQQNNKQSRLGLFKKLYKQIGCGEKTLVFDTIKEGRLKERIEMTKNSGEFYFAEISKEHKENSDIIVNISDLIDWLKNRNGDYNGIFWSEKAMNNILGPYQSRFFVSYVDLGQKLVYETVTINKKGEKKIKEEKVFEKGDIKKDEKFKAAKVMELSKLFAGLNSQRADWFMKDKDESGTEKEVWKIKGKFFKDGFFENERTRKIIEESQKPSEALLGIILSDIEENIENFLGRSKNILKIEESETREDKNREIIKEWLDSALRINLILKYFKVKEKVLQKKSLSMNSVLSNALDDLLFSSGNALENPTENYDAIRNYLTKKPQSELNKLKLNFENAKLAAGWDLNKQKNNSCVILKDEDKNKYLAVMKYSDTKVFEKEPNLELFESDNSGWTKMSYKYFPDASRMIPKCSTQLKKVKQHFLKNESDYTIPEGHKVSSGEKFIDNLKITKEIWELNNRIYNPKNIEQSEIKSNDKHKDWIKAFQKEMSDLNNDLYRKALPIWIDFCRDFLPKYPSSAMFKYDFKNTKDYDSIDKFYYDVDISTYKLNFQYDIDDESKNPKLNFINKAKLDEYVRNGKVYLFEIRSRDNNLANGKEKLSAKNLQTIYWDAVFGEADNKPKLNGEAEIFYRPALLESKMKKAIRTDKDGNKIEIKLKSGGTALQNFRFSKEKFIFHCPITFNFCLKEMKLNDKLNAELVKSENGKGAYFLGIDRGEKHLAYYSLIYYSFINQNVELLKQGSFNVVKDENTGKETDYLKLLEEKAGNRDDARKNWTTIGTIKELKDGYISQVIRRIVDLTIYENTETKELREMPAFIVLEDLNIGFKRGRQKIEKQVYQKLELALAKKLNFLVDKKAEIGEIGSVTKAIQLTPPVNNFGDMENRKQFGNMLYIRADYTSQTDPATGWRKSIYLKSDSESNVKEQIEKSFSDIRYESGDYCFEYRDRHGKMWQLYSSKNGVSLDRFHGERNNSKNIWESERQPLNEMLNVLFDEKRFDKSKSLYEQMFKGGVELTRLPKEINKKDKPAWESLRFVIMLIQQIRNTGQEGDNRNGDFIQSPVRDEKTGEHFDSRIYLDQEQRGEKADLPTSGDANGAYNIARKGIIVAEHIKRGFDKLYISDEEWDAWLAGNAIWDKWLRKNSKK